MKIEVKTGSYNERRYSKPWIARVNFSTNPRGDFEWGVWVGDEGNDGLLIVDAEEGDIVAKGQKDYRKPANSAPDFYQVRGGQLVHLGGRAEAYKLSKS